MGTMTLRDAAGRVIFSTEVRSVFNSEGDKMKLEDMVKEFEKTQREIEARKARRSPDANKLTKVMRAHRSFSFYAAGKDARGYDVRFCVAHHVNVAGYVLTWKQVDGKNRFGKDVLKRSKWAALKTRQGALNIARKRAVRWRQKHELPFGDEHIDFVRTAW